MTEYELMYIVPTIDTEEGVGAVEAFISASLAKAGANTLKTVRLGKFRLAYPIRHQPYGHYMLVRFTAEPSVVAPVNEAIRLAPDKILRHLILKAHEAGDEKFDLVQFQEVNVEGRDDRYRRSKVAKVERVEKDKAAEAQKAGVAALEEAKAEETTVAEVEKLSPEELQKKIDEALQEKA